VKQHWLTAFRPWYAFALFAVMGVSELPGVFDGDLVGRWVSAGIVLVTLGFGVGYLLSGIYVASGRRIRSFWPWTVIRVAEAAYIDVRIVQWAVASYRPVVILTDGRVRKVYLASWSERRATVMARRLSAWTGIPLSSPLASEAPRDPNRPARRSAGQNP
jgi:hypothetical protein